jgi:hypothetical protein
VLPLFIGCLYTVCLVVLKDSVMLVAAKLFLESFLKASLTSRRSLISSSDNLLCVY